MESGTLGSSTAMESGQALKMTLISVSGTSRKPMVSVCILGRTETGTKASGRCVLSMVKEQTLSLIQAKYTQVSTKMDNHTVKAPTLGQMEKSMKAIS